MRILRLVLRVGPTSAPYNQFTLPALDEHDITLCTFFPGFDKPDERIEYHPGDGHLVSFVRRLWKLLRHASLDAVHIHSPHLGIIFLIVACVARPGVLRRTVMHAHSSYPVYRPRNRWMLLPCFATFSRLVCCGHASRASFPWLYQQLAGRRLITIRNGVDLRRVDAAQPPCADAPAAEPPPLQLITVGHLRPLKDQVTVIRAVARVRTVDVHLTVVGNGPRTTWLRRLAQVLGVEDRVTFTGQISRDQTLQRLWQSDLFVSMSRGEGLPVAVLEAMSCHCPLILSDIPPHREITNSLGAGVRLVPCKDIYRLTSEIETLGRLPIQQRNQLGVTCRRHVEASFSLEQMHDQYTALLEELVQQHVPPVKKLVLE